MQILIQTNANKRNKSSCPAFPKSVLFLSTTLICLFLRNRDHRNKKADYVLYKIVIFDNRQHRARSYFLVYKGPRLLPYQICVVSQFIRGTPVSRNTDNFKCDRCHFCYHQTGGGVYPFE